MKNGSKQNSELLLKVNNDLAISNSLDDALDILINITCSVISAERGTVFINDKNSNELYSRFAKGDLKRDIRFMNHYIQHGDWPSNFYGEYEDKRVTWKTIT